MVLRALPRGPLGEADDRRGTCRPGHDPLHLAAAGKHGNARLVSPPRDEGEVVAPALVLSGGDERGLHEHEVLRDEGEFPQVGRGPGGMRHGLVRRDPECAGTGDDHAGPHRDPQFLLPAVLSLSDDRLGLLCLSWNADAEEIVRRAVHDLRNRISRLHAGPRGWSASCLSRRHSTCL